MPPDPAGRRKHLSAAVHFINTLKERIERKGGKKPKKRWI